MLEPLKEKVSDFIKNYEEYVPMRVLVEEFGFDVVDVLWELMKEGSIIIDSRDHTVIWTAVDNPKLKELIDKSVRIL